MPHSWGQIPDFNLRVTTNKNTSITSWP